MKIRTRSMSNFSERLDNHRILLTSRRNQRECRQFYKFLWIVNAIGVNNNASTEMIG